MFFPVLKNVVLKKEKLKKKEKTDRPVYHGYVPKNEEVKKCN